MPRIRVILDVWTMDDDDEDTIAKMVRRQMRQNPDLNDFRVVSAEEMTDK